MHEKRRWLPRWQRVELVELCLVQGLTRRQAAAWRRVSVSTVQYWVERSSPGDRGGSRVGWVGGRSFVHAGRVARLAQPLQHHDLHAATTQITFDAAGDMPPQPGTRPYDDRVAQVALGLLREDRGRLVAADDPDNRGIRRKMLERVAHAFDRCRFGVELAYNSRPGDNDLNRLGATDITTRQPMLRRAILTAWRSTSIDPPTLSKPTSSRRALIRCDGSRRSVSFPAHEPGQVYVPGRR